MLHRPAFINSSTGGYKVAAPILTHAWVPFSILINAVHDPYILVSPSSYDPTDIQVYFRQHPSYRFSIILIHNYWALHAVAKGFHG
jgi:hypothetical protein